MIELEPEPSHDRGAERASFSPRSGPIVVRIEPPRRGLSLELRDLWTYRELLYFLTWRDIRVRYKQTALGAAWAIIQPFFTMVVFSVFFGKLAKVSSDNLPYPVFSFAALVPWQFFASGLAQSSNSLVGSSNLIKKVYFPRFVIPISAIMSGLVDFAIALVVLFGMMAYFHIVPNYHLVWILPLIVLALITALGAGLWLSAFSVQYRDVRYVVPFLTQFWMFATPIAYPTSIVPTHWRVLYGLNPMVGVVDGFRWALLGTNTAPGPIIAVSALTASIALITGAYYFKRRESAFADVI